MSPNPATPHRHARVLACVLCQHRKIKCDRSFPCANCTKANVACTPSTPAPPRKRRRPNQDLQKRLSRCEELLKQYANGAVPPPPPPPPGLSPPTPTADALKTEPSEAMSAGPDSQESWRPACVMVNDEGGARFMDSYIWASVYEELQAMRDIVETDDLEDSSILGSEDLTPDNNTDLFFPGNLATLNLDDLQPDPIHSFKLWQLFLDRVNPLTKVIHAPTVQPRVMEAAASISSIPLHDQALLFAIYTMGAMSLSEAECLQSLGISREAAVQKYSTGTKAALSRYSFLKNYNMSVLQALVLYFYSLQGRHDRHASWILSGTVVRIAQKMGYHRDGERLNLDPCETEMRRRVWWQIVIQDSKYAMLSGLRQTMLPLRWDTQMPQNVNDADIMPGSAEPIQPRQGPTEMAFCIMLNEIYKFKMAADNANDGPAFEAAMLGQNLDSPSDSSPTQETTLDRFRLQAQALETRLLELEKQYVDVNAGHVHKAALAIRRMITNKLGEMLVPVREQPEWGTEIFGPKDSLFKVVILGNEQRMEAFEMLQHTDFLWFVRLHFQLDMFAVMTGQLCQRPTGSLADRAWAVTETAYGHHAELYDVSQRQYWIQALFTVKAWKTCERAFMQAGQALETPHFIHRLRELVAVSHDGRSSMQPSTTPPTLPHQQLPSQLNLHQQKQQQQQHSEQHQQQQQPQQQGVMDPFLGGYLDMASLNWDVFGGDLVGNGGDDLSAAMFGGLGLGPMSGAGPSAQ